MKSGIPQQIYFITEVAVALQRQKDHVAKALHPGARDRRAAVARCHVALDHIHGQEATVDLQHLNAQDVQDQQLQTILEAIHLAHAVAHHIIQDLILISFFLTS